MSGTSKIPLARVWLASGSYVDVETREEWESINPDDFVVFVAQRLPAGGNFPAQGDYYWLGSDGEIQPFVGSYQTLCRSLAHDGDPNAYSDTMLRAKSGVTLLRTAYNALMVEGMAWARGADCEGC